MKAHHTLHLILVVFVALVIVKVVAQKTNLPGVKTLAAYL